ncbi:MAG: creatininase family protein [Phycisphaerae bacterium]|nr:creatininase family protein [Phycisphaerae bacterium]
MGQLKKYKYEVAVISTSATEAHNQHLPEGQDVLHTSYVANEVARIAFEQTQSVIALPIIPFGVDCNLMAFPLTVHISQDTLNLVLLDIIKSLMSHGIRKIVILNGHGGNDFGPFVRQTQCDLDVHLFVCHWWKVAMDCYDQIFDRPDDHAGQMETSVGLELFPDLIELDTAGDGIARKYRFEALEKGWAKTSRDFGKVNPNCACGDPNGATAEKGRQYLDIAVGRIAEFLIQLANEPIDADFPHEK